MITITSEEAQNRFGQLLDKAQREPVRITRDGRAAAFIISPQDMEELLDARRRRSEALAEFEAYFAKADAGLTPAGQALTDEDVIKLVRKLR